MPGTLRAIGLKDGEMKESVEFQTTGAVSGLRLIPEQSVIKADRDEIAFIRVEAIDPEGRIVPYANFEVSTDVHGNGELIAAGVP